MPAAALQHRRQQRVRQRDRRAQVDVERAVDLLDREATPGAPTPGSAGVGDQDVDLAGLADAGARPRPVAEVDGQRARVELGGERLEHVGAPPGEDQLGAAPVQRAGDRVADAAGGAGEQDGGAGDLHELRAYDNADHRAVRPDRRGQDRVAVALAEQLRARGEEVPEPRRGVGRRAAGVRGPGDAHRRGLAGRAGDARASPGLVPAARRDVQRRASTRELAHAEIDGLLAAGRRPIVVGGTGLYLRAALTELDLRPPPPEGARERWTAELEREGAPALHALLARRAPWAAEGIDPNDRQRIVRALELLELGELEPPEGPSQLWSEELRHPTLLAGLTMEREALYARIDARVEAMLAAGVAEEVRRAHAAGASETARKALGFEELLGGDVEAMKRRTRNYAKRQLTWMRKLAGVRVIDVTGRDPDAVAREILDSGAVSPKQRPGAEAAR